MDRLSPSSCVGAAVLAKRQSLQLPKPIRPSSELQQVQPLQEQPTLASPDRST